MAAAQPSWVRDALALPAPTGIDPNASEITLFDSRTVTIHPDAHARIHVRRLIRHLTAPGMDASAITEYTTPLRSVDHILGWLITSEGEIRDLPQEWIVTLGQSSIPGYYDESKTVVAMIPGVRAGDAVAFEYDVRDDDRTATMQEFSFQVQEPVRHAEFSVEVPRGWILHRTERNLSGVTFTQDGDRYSWRATDLPYRPDEPLSPSWSYLHRQVVCTAFSPDDPAADIYRSWTGVSRWADSIATPRAAVDDAVRGEARRLTDSSGSPAARVRILAAHVRDQIRYVALEVGDGRWEPHRAASILHDRYGDCKDKVTLLRALLAAADIPSHLVLVNTSQDVDSASPSPFQFNHAIVAIPSSAIGDSSAWRPASAGGYVFFDPTNEMVPFGALPVQEQGSFALVAAPGTTGLVKLPYGSVSEFRRRSETSVTVGADGSLNGSVHFVMRGAYAHRIRHLFTTSTGEEQLSTVRSWFLSSLGEVTLVGLRAAGTEDSFDVAVSFNAPRGITASGKARIVPTGIVLDREYPALTAPARALPIWFGGPSIVEYDVRVRVPEDWTTDAAGLERMSTCVDQARLTYRLTGTGREFHLSGTLTNEGYLLPVSRYAEARSFIRDVRAFLNLTILLQTP